MACNESQPQVLSETLSDDQVGTWEPELPGTSELAVDGFEPDRVAGNAEPACSGASAGSFRFKNNETESDMEESSSGGSSHSSQDFSSEYRSETSDTQSVVSSQESESDVGRESNCSASDNSSDLSDISSPSDDYEAELRPLYDTCKFSTDEGVLDIVTDHVKNHETMNGLKDHLRTFLKFIPPNNGMPKNSKQLLD